VKPSKIDDAAMGVAPAARLQFGGAVLRSSFMFAFQWLVARSYGPAVFGTMNLALAGFQTATMLGRAAGDNIVLREQQGADPRATFTVGVTLSLVAGILAALVLVAWGFWLAGGDLMSAVGRSFLLVSCGVPAAAVLFPLGAGLRRDLRFGAYTWTATLLEPLARVGIVGIAVIVGWSDIIAVAVIPISAAVTCAFAIFLQRDKLNELPSLSAAGRITNLLRYSSTMTLAAAINTGFLFVQLTLLTILARESETGILAAAGRIAMLALWVQWAFSAPFTPVIARTIAKHGDRSELIDGYRHVIASVLWVNTPFLAGILVAAPAIMGVFGEGFEDGALLLAVLAVGQWVNSATALAEEFLPLSHRSSLALWNNIGALLLLIGLGLPLGARYGALGVAIAGAFAVIALNLLRAVQVRRIFGVPTPKRTTLVAGLSAVLIAGSLVTGAWSLHDQPILQFLLGAVAALLTAILMWVFGTHEDRHVLKGFLHGRAPVSEAHVR
jgi:O-antigen/teichoic acid export membrane protein